MRALLLLFECNPLKLIVSVSERRRTRIHGKRCPFSSNKSRKKFVDDEKYFEVENRVNGSQVGWLKFSKVPFG